jgi:SAM-dependent methyltransferase
VSVVVGHRDQEAFALSRRASVEFILERLAEIGVSISDLPSLLDFGCGCGRVLAGWEGLLPSGSQLHGCDTNETLVEFCQESIPYATVVISQDMPPLPYPNARFDFVYAASVFSQITLPAMLQWAGEFARILKPGALAMVTIRGSYYAHELAQPDLKDASRHLYERGYYVHGSNPEATFATIDFMQRIFAGFDLLQTFPGISHGPTPLAAYQDILIFRRHIS